VEQFCVEVIHTPAPSAMLCPITIGRERELESIKGLIDQLQTAPASATTVLITGEAGIGKSRLVAEARSYALSHGVRVSRVLRSRWTARLHMGPSRTSSEAFYNSAKGRNSKPWRVSVQGVNRS
jgi:AAA ATPase domain